MDYRLALQSHLTCDINIGYLVNTIMNNFRLSKKYEKKCASIVTSKMQKYLDLLETYPSNQEELVQAIEYLNKMCFSDFAAYLQSKNPNKNIYRQTQNIQSINQPVSQPINQQPVITEIIDQSEIDNFLSVYKKKTEPDILTTKLSDPLVMQLFSMLAKQQTSNPVQSSSPFIVEEILDSNELLSMLGKKSNEQKPSKRDITESIEPTVEPINEPKSKKSFIEPMDLSNITKDKLNDMVKRIKELVDLKNECSVNGQHDLIQQIDDERMRIMSTIMEHKKSLKETVSKSTFFKIAQDSSNDKHNTMSLEIDPTQDHKCLKDMVIKITNDENVDEIQLLGYNIPYNKNNINRFNNIFRLFFNDRIHNIVIPTGKYDIDMLLSAISSKADYLDFSIDTEKKLVTVKNKLDIEFDLMLGDDTMFRMLGFTDSLDEYKGLKKYTSNVAYNLEANNSMFLSISGSTQEPLKIDFNKDVIFDKPFVLKKVMKGSIFSKIKVNLFDNMELMYDVVSPFKLSLRVTYQNDE